MLIAVPDLKTALIVHPYLKIWAGGELLCLHVMNALIEEGYSVKLFSDTNDESEARKIYPEISHILREVEWIEVPKMESHLKLLPPLMRMIRSGITEKKIHQMLDAEKFNIVFHTQSTVFPTDRSPTIHFSYDPLDLYSISPYSGESIYKWKPEISGISKNYLWQTTRKPLRSIVRKIIGINNPKPKLICTPSKSTERILRKKSSNVRFFVPIARQPTPLPKKRQVIQVSRLVHFKRVELFLDAARSLPSEKFILIGRIAKEEKEYGEKILSGIPPNVEFINGNLTDNYNRLRESSVYLHTGNETAFMLTVAEAVSAGCYPIISRDSGSFETIKRVTGVGSPFTSFSDLIDRLQYALLGNFETQIISRQAEPFQAEHFKYWVQDTVREIT